MYSHRLPEKLDKLDNFRLGNYPVLQYFENQFIQWASSSFPGLLFGLTMIMVSIALVMAVVVTNIYLRKDNGVRVPAITRPIFLPNTTSSAQQRLSRTPLTDKVTSTSAENHVNEIRVPEIEMDNLSMLSELETLTSSKQLKNSNSIRRRSGGNSYTRSKHHHDAYLPDVVEGQKDRVTQEWIMLSKAVDRVFFWLFLLASIGALLWMFCSIPHMNAT